MKEPQSQRRQLGIVDAPHHRPDAELGRVLPDLLHAHTGEHAAARVEIRAHLAVVGGRTGDELLNERRFAAGQYGLEQSHQRRRAVDPECLVARAVPAPEVTDRGFDDERVPECAGKPPHLVDVRGDVRRWQRNASRLCREVLAALVQRNRDGISGRQRVHEIRLQHVAWLRHERGECIGGEAQDRWFGPPSRSGGEEVDQRVGLLHWIGTEGMRPVPRAESVLRAIVIEAVHGNARAPARPNDGQARVEETKDEGMAGFTVPVTMCRGRAGLRLPLS